DAAADLPPEGRREYLDRHCPDPYVRQRVERLLAADAEADGEPLAEPAPPAPEARPKEVGPGGPPRVSIGPYRVLRELGRGAYGVVYHAFDDVLGRPGGDQGPPRGRHPGRRRQ